MIHFLRTFRKRDNIISVMVARHGALKTEYQREFPTGQKVLLACAKIMKVSTQKESCQVIFEYCQTKWKTRKRGTILYPFWLLTGFWLLPTDLLLIMTGWLRAKMFVDLQPSDFAWQKKLTYFATSFACLSMKLELCYILWWVISPCCSK